MGSSGGGVDILRGSVLRGGWEVVEKGGWVLLGQVERK